jgi:hypothetical protein
LSANIGTAISITAPIAITVMMIVKFVRNSLAVIRSSRRVDRRRRTVRGI